VSHIAATQATRASQLKLARRLEQVDKGAALLSKKRDALVTQLFARVRPGVEARRQIDVLAATAYARLADALAASGQADLATLAWPSRELRVEVGEGAALTLHATLVRDAAARGWWPGQLSGEALPAARAFERLIESVLASAAEEAAIQRLSEQLARTVRQVNVLEQKFAVELRQALTRTRRTLDEREREEALRLRRIAARRGT
jgi:V/A-type H+/Na+-transporting ATPase subunit D